MTGPRSKWHKFWILLWKVHLFETLFPNNSFARCQSCSVIRPPRKHTKIKRLWIWSALSQQQKKKILDQMISIYIYIPIVSCMRGTLHTVQRGALSSADVGSPLGRHTLHSYGLAQMMALLPGKDQLVTVVISAYVATLPHKFFPGRLCPPLTVLRETHPAFFWTGATTLVVRSAYPRFRIGRHNSVGS